MIGPCGFIPVRLSIFLPDLGTSVPLSKLLRGGVVPITVSLSDWLVGVEDDFLNSRVCPIHCESPEWVHDTY